MINKVIHYCWFGKKPLSNLEIKCIASWKKYMPEYKIREWNESNFDIKCCKYVEHAYEQKKWAFVSDYARFWILYNYGGLYFDTDVEIIRNMDEIIAKGPFMGCECNATGKVGGVAPGLGLSAVPRLSFYRDILDYYESLNFEYAEGKVDTVVTHVTKLLKEKGFVGNGLIERIEDIWIYPPDYFCPMNPFTGEVVITDNTVSIHHYTASWQNNFMKFKSRIQKIIGPQLTKKVIDIKKSWRNI